MTWFVPSISLVRTRVRQAVTMVREKTERWRVRERTVSVDVEVEVEVVRVGRVRVWVVEGVEGRVMGGEVIALSSEARAKRGERKVDEEEESSGQHGRLKEVG